MTIAGQIPIKTGRWDASLALWDFSQINKAMHPALYNKYNLHLSLRYWNARISQAVVRSCSVSEVFLKILQNSQVFPLAQEFPVNFATFWRTPFFAEHLKWLLLAFAPIEIFYSHTVCNKSAAEAWMLTFFLWWSKRLHFHMYFP